LLIMLGLVSIERALAVLFRIGTGEFLYRWVTPVVFGRVAPVYWLSTLPRLSDYDAAALDRPDFVMAAGGAIARFVAAPLLFVYAAILLVYAVQIAVTQTLPQGMLGWMVLGFVVSGAATWL